MVRLWLSKHLKAFAKTTFDPGCLSFLSLKTALLNSVQVGGKPSSGIVSL